MVPILETAVAGLVGTALMSAVMASIHRSGWANADMIRAIGSFATRSYENALAPGLLIHLLAGVVFAFPYAAVLSGLAHGGPLLTLGLGALLGFAHGLVMSFILLSVVSERHPLPQFRGASVEVAVAHVAGHLAYGFGVAAVVAILKIDWAPFL